MENLLETGVPRTADEEELPMEAGEPVLGEECRRRQEAEQSRNGKPVALGVEPRGEWLRDRSGLDIREESAAT